MKLKKVVRNIKKIPKGPQKYSRKALKELREEAKDFFEDFFDDGFARKRIKRLKRIKLYGAVVATRPAYIFAEKVENTLKVISGASIVASGISATFLGFPKTSELLVTLISSLFGRVLMVVIGFSYFIVGLWKILNIKR